MKLDFRQRLLTTTLFVGVGALATPAFAQTTPTPPNPADTAGAANAQPETTTPVEGQTTVPSTNAQGEPVKSTQDIVITGTRIPQPNLTSASPVTVLTSQEVKLSGTSRAEDLINSLPQSFAAQGSNLSNGASGTATVNLRNLGASRTLVLINGRRLMAGDNRTPYPDIDFIPIQLVKRVDVLTGGASSVYGADAVGGVVNFIMDNTFTGLRIDAQASFFQHDNRDDGDVRDANDASGYRAPRGLSTNGGTADIAAVLGAAFDDGRGHVQAYATYRKQRPVLQSTRDYSFCGLSGFDPATAADAGNKFYCGGSATTSPTLLYSPSGGYLYSAGPNHTLTPGYTPFNFNPYNYYQRPDERYTFGAFADYEISPGAKPYLEAMFMDDRSNAVIAPSGAFFGLVNNLNCDNALLSAEQQALCVPALYNPADVNPALSPAGNPIYQSTFGNLVGQTPIFGPDPDGNGPLPAPLLGFTAPTAFNNGSGGTYNQANVFIARRNVEGGGRVDQLSHTDYRIVAGMRGDLLRGISYDASYQYGHVLTTDTHLNDFSTSRLRRALDVVADPETGQPVCRSVITGLDPNCVPYDIFTVGGVTQDALNYLQVPGIYTGTVEETIAHADMTVQGAEYGVKTPWAENGVGLNFGAEYRKEKSDFNPDVEWQTGDLAGNGSTTPPVHGQFDVRELFAEVQVPIVEHSFIDLLQLSAGYRFSNYKVAGNSFNTDTYKLSLEFAPIRDIRFRGSYNRAVRAPNVVELFTPQLVGLFGNADPCANRAVTDANPLGLPSATQAQCALSGVTAAQYGTILRNPSNQYNGLAGGNPNLQPEVADSWTGGVVIQPRFIPGLALTADYFNIKVKNVIGTPAYLGVLNSCMGLNGETPDPTQCALINRDQFGSLWITPNGFVTIINQNFPGVNLATKGWDFSGSYSRKFGGMGTLNASFVGTLQGKTATLGGAGTGEYNADSIPINKFKSKMRVGFTLPNGITLSGQWRHFSSVKCVGQDECANPADAKIPAQDYFDLAMTARITNKFNLRFGANNITDKAPPLVGSEVGTGVYYNGNTFPQIYDSLGRYMFAGVSVDF
jgi:iron complex outermembrane recepter protein